MANVASLLPEVIVPLEPGRVSIGDVAPRLKNGVVRVCVWTNIELIIRGDSEWGGVCPKSVGAQADAPIAALGISTRQMSPTDWLVAGNQVVSGNIRGLTGPEANGIFGTACHTMARKLGSLLGATGLADAQTKEGLGPWDSSLEAPTFRLELWTWAMLLSEQGLSTASIQA